MKLTRLLLLTTMATLLPGQLVRIPIYQSAVITFSDISAFLTVISFITATLFKGIKLKFPREIYFAALLFVISAAVSSTLALNFYRPAQIASSSLFLVRFVLYFCLILIVKNTVKKGEIINWLNALLAIGTVFTFLGIIQFITLTDLSFLTVYGWDPHQNRLVSTLIDPNYSGLLIVFFLTLAASLFLFTKKMIYLPLCLLFFTGVILTFSRSSYLSLLISMLFIGFARSKYIILAGTLFFLIAFLFIPRIGERLIGAITIDETAQARIISWQNSYEIFSKNWLFGVGFNNYRYAQEKYGNFTPDDPAGGHSGSGSDSSFLLVAATTGIFGLLFFLFFILTIFKSLAKKLRGDWLKLAALASFLGLLVHTQFVNSLFFPQIILVFWFILGLSLVEE